MTEPPCESWKSDLGPLQKQPFLQLLCSKLYVHDELYEAFSQEARYISEYSSQGLSLTLSLAAGSWHCLCKVLNVTLSLKMPFSLWSAFPYLLLLPCLAFLALF